MDIERMVQIYRCEDTVDGILSAIYEAGISGYGHDYIRIEPIRMDSPANLSLFAEYIDVETEQEKAEKVIRAVYEKISARAYTYLMYAVAADAPDRGDALYQFLVHGFSMGDKACDALSIPSVKRVFELKRAVGNESHYSREFMRFKEISREPRIMLATFEPANRVLPMVMEHFRDRFQSEWFIIFDRHHMEAGFHTAENEMAVRLLTKEEAERLEALSEKEEDYVALWKTFFHAIAIEERRNEKLQRNHMPLHYRTYVTEFIE